MSADIDNQPYDNVEFPVKRPGPGSSGGWISPTMTAAQREHLVTGVTTKDRVYTLAPVVEGMIGEEEEEASEVTVEDQRQRVGGTIPGPDQRQRVGGTVPTGTNVGSPQSVITTAPKSAKANHIVSSTQDNQLKVNTEKTTGKVDTFPRSVIIKPPPSPSRDSHTSVQTNPPEEFTWSAFTPKSQDVFEQAYQRHKYFYKFSDKVMKQGTKMKTSVWDVPGKPGETMTYEQLLQGVMCDGERLLLGGSWLHFRCVEFFDAECKNHVKPALGEGRICLTNIRMLLLCAEISLGADISEYGDHLKDKGDKDGGYRLTVSKLNNVFFQNIPIDCFESVELSSTVGVTSESKLTEKQPTCCGLFSCVGVGRCGNTWNASPPLPVNIVKRVIRLGVYLPPWRTPAILLVHLHPKMSLSSARDFVTKLQNNVPQMQYHHIKHGATVL